MPGTRSVRRCRSRIGKYGLPCRWRRLETRCCSKQSANSFRAVGWAFSKESATAAGRSHRVRCRSRRVPETLAIAGGIPHRPPVLRRPARYRGVAPGRARPRLRQTPRVRRRPPRHRLRAGSSPAGGHPTPTDWEGLAAGSSGSTIGILPARQSRRARLGVRGLTGETFPGGAGDRARGSAVLKSRPWDGSAIHRGGGRPAWNSRGSRPCRGPW